MNNYNCYIHIPFCRSKCKYCRFASFSVLDKLKIQNYVDFLCREIEDSRKLKIKSIKLDTIYFGGGTPTTLSEKQFRQIFKSLEKKFVFSENIEINVESTPEEISLEKLKYLEKLGVNRISIGVQSLNKKTLEEVKRDKKGSIEEKLDIIHQFLTSSKQNSGNGVFDTPISISLDFIIGLPFVKSGETLKDIQYILEKYDFIKHLSVYMLEDYYEPGEEKTEKFEQIVYPENWENNSISFEDIGKEYLEIKDFLEKKGFFRYEFSNFAKKGFECKHNLGYWTHKETLAFGLGASGFLGNTRYKNSEDFLEYYAAKGKQEEKLLENDIFLEKIMFSLRTSGISKDLVKKLSTKKVNYFLENNLLEKNGEKIVVSDSGALYLDYIIGEII